MKLMRRTARTAIGLDVGASAVKAVQLAGGAGRWRIVAATRLPRPDEAEGQDPQEQEEAHGRIGPAELAEVQASLQRQGFQGRRVAVAVPREKLVNGVVDLPAAESGAPVEQIARMELASMSKLEPQSLEMAWWPLPASVRRREGSRAMAAGCETEQADAVIEAFESGGLEVSVLDVEAVAAARAIEYMTAGSRERIVSMIDLGYASARLAIVYQGAVIYERELGEWGLRPVWDQLRSAVDADDELLTYLIGDVGLRETGPGGQPIDPTLRSELHAAISDHYEDMAHEVMISTSYATHQYPEVEPGPLMLIGGGASIPGLAEHIAGRVEMEVEPVRPTQEQRLPCSAGLEAMGEDPGLITAAGLAMHEEAQ